MDRKCCIITGGSRGIGLAAALKSADAGYDVVIAARTESGLRGAAAQVQRRGTRCEWIVADLAQPREAARVVEQAAQRFGRIDLLVNNAAHAPLAPIDVTTTEDFERTVALNIGAVFHATRAAWPLMKSQGGGVLVNVSSMASVDPFRGFSIYGASKAWVNLFTQAIAEEGRPLGIRAFAVAPGAVETQMLRANFPDIPRDRTLEPADVAAVILSLCDERMRHCSGQTIFVRK